MGFVIENEQQYQRTKDWIAKFSNSVTELEQRSGDDGSEAAFWRKVEADGLRSQIADMQRQMEDYEDRQSCRYVILELGTFEEIPQLLLDVRIAHDLSPEEFAQRLGIDEQQLACYEATEYASATVTQLSQMLRALGIKVRGRVFAPARKWPPLDVPTAEAAGRA